MAILCYTITGSSRPNPRSTTGAENGHVSAIIKGDHQEASAQLYSELAANRLAMFLGIPVALGVPARRARSSTGLRFASLRAAEVGLNVYDFTRDSEDDGLGVDLPAGAFHNAGHMRATKALCDKYPSEAAAIAVFDLWIGNQDRALNFKAQIESSERGVIFALDQGSSLLSCRSTIDDSLKQLESAAYPDLHPFQRLLDGRLCGEMIERVRSMPDWSIEAATVYQDSVGSVLPVDQYQCFSVLRDRKKLLGDLVHRVLL